MKKTIILSLLLSLIALTSCGGGGTSGGGTGGGTVGTPATAVVEVGLKNSYSNAFSLVFKLGATPAASVPTQPAVVAINEAAGLVGSRFALLADYSTGVATVNLIKDDSNGNGFNIVANKPVVRLTYNLATGPLPTFDVTVSSTPLGLTDPADPSGAAIIPTSLITAADFVVSTTFKDANGNTVP